MTERPQSAFGEHLSVRQQLGRAALSAGPGIAWITLFLLVPLAGIGVMSLLGRGPYGQIEPAITFQNYSRFLGFGAFGFDPVYLVILWRSLVLAAGTTALCIAASLPLAFFIAGLSQRRKDLALMLVVIPFWTNLLIRTYAWQIILSGSGWPARVAAGLGLIEPGSALYPSAFAVFVGLVCDYLPFLALPLYASVEKLDWTIAEAASDLGANRWQVFRHAILPQILPGLLAGSMLVFIPASGQFVIPDLLGGAKTILIGSAIQQQFGPSRDWPFGSAIACFAMGLVMAGLWFYARAIAEEPGKVE